MSGILVQPLPFRPDPLALRSFVRQLANELAEGLEGVKIRSPPTSPQTTPEARLAGGKSPVQFSVAPGQSMMLPAVQRLARSQYCLFPSKSGGSGAQAMEDDSLLKQAVAKWSENCEMSDALQQDGPHAEPPTKMVVQRAVPMHRRIAQLRGEDRSMWKEHHREQRQSHKVKRRRTNSMDLSSDGR